MKEKPGPWFQTSDEKPDLHTWRIINRGNDGCLQKEMRAAWDGGLPAIYYTKELELLRIDTMNEANWTLDKK